MKYFWILALLLFTQITTLIAQDELGVDPIYLNEHYNSDNTTYVDKLYGLDKYYLVHPIVTEEQKVMKLVMTPCNEKGEKRYISKEEIHSIASSIEKEYGLKMKWNSQGEYGYGSYTWKNTDPRYEDGSNLYYGRKSMIQINILGFNDSKKNDGFYLSISYTDFDLIDQKKNEIKDSKKTKKGGKKDKRKGYKW